MTSIHDILKNKMTEPQEYYIAIGLFFEQWQRCKSICDAFFNEAQRSYQHMNLTDAHNLYESLCKTIEDIEPSELRFIPTSTKESND